MKSTCLAVVLSLVALAPLSAHADDTGPAAAKAHFDKAMILYNIQDWPSAIKELKAAYTTDAKPEYLYTLAQAQRLSGDCNSAILSYRAFERGATPAAATAAEGFIHKCEEQIKADEAKSAASATATLAPSTQSAASPSMAPAPVAPPPPAPRNSTWIKDPLGDVLAVAAIGGLAVGSVFFAQASSASSAATGGATEGGWASNNSSAKTDSVIGAVGISAGGLLLAGAVWRYVVVSHRDKEQPPPPNVGLWVGQSGLQLSYGASF